MIFNFFFCLEKTIVVTLTTFEQITPQKLWPNFIATLSLYFLDVCGPMSWVVNLNYMSMKWTVRGFNGACQEFIGAALLLNDSAI